MIYDENKYKEIILDPKKKYKNLNCSISLPSTLHVFSVATEYIKDWILRKLPAIQFNSSHVAGKHVYDDFKKIELKELVKKPNPLLLIKPNINLEYNRDLLDSNSYGLETMVRTGRLNKAFYKDYKNDTFIGHSMELLDIDYSIMIKLETKAQQVDAYKYATFALRCGNKLEEMIDMNYHIPRSLMIQCAKDNGFELRYNTHTGDYDIDKVYDFLKHINSNSLFPVMYAMRGVDGNNGFFLRYPELDLTIEPSAIETDDGDKLGMLTSDYTLAFTINMKIPSIQSYYYYSSNEHKIIALPSFYKPKEGDVIYPIACFKMERIPDVNSRGWNKYITTEYYEDDLSKPLEIDFTPLLEGGVSTYNVIREYIKMGVDINDLVEFKILNHESFVDFTVDWKNNKLTTKECMKHESSYIALYMDTATINAKAIELENMTKNRVKNTKNADRVN